MTNQIGLRAQGSVADMIFRKVLKISKATNKKFTEGQILNFVQSDTQQLQMMSN